VRIFDARAPALDRADLANKQAFMPSDVPRDKFIGDQEIAQVDYITNIKQQLTNEHG
jgi:hypothetical protein